MAHLTPQSPLLANATCNDPDTSTNDQEVRQRDEPLRTSFILTSMPVGGAETLLVNLIHRIDRTLIAPEIICLKEPGPLGEQMSRRIPVHSRFLRSKWDIRVLWRLREHFKSARTDAVVTVGAGDKMFWGRLAARLAHVPVICSALHSTGWPDGVGRLNRKLTCITDAFIAVAQDHAQFLVNYEDFPQDRVFMIPNGVDADRFRPNHTRRKWLRESLEISLDAPLVGTVAALREEKNHFQFVAAARDILRAFPETVFVMVGDGPMRSSIEHEINNQGLTRSFRMLGTRPDTADILAGLDVFVLTSKNEANPVSVLEALACGLPVVSTNVGSIHETVLDGKSGYLTEPLNTDETADAVIKLLGNPSLAVAFGRTGREHVRRHWSLNSMVSGYERLITSLYNAKVPSTERLLRQSRKRRPVEDESDDPVGLRLTASMASNSSLACLSPPTGVPS